MGKLWECSHLRIGGRRETQGQLQQERQGLALCVINWGPYFLRPGPPSLCAHAFRPSLHPVAASDG